MTLADLAAFTDAPGTIGDVLEQFAMALGEASGEAALEIGVRSGGTSAAMCMLAAHRPDFLVIGVDPWGNAPYIEGGRDVAAALDYGESHYVAARALLSRFPNHALFRMDADTFLDAVLPRFRWWRRGESHPVAPRWLSFCFLDGPHDDADVCREALQVFPLLAVGGRICIDNADHCAAAVACLASVPTLERITMRHDRVAFRRTRL